MSETSSLERTLKLNIYKINNTSDSNVKELKIDSTLWATSAKIINLLDFKPEKLSIKTENDDEYGCRTSSKI